MHSHLGADLFHPQALGVISSALRSCWPPFPLCFATVVTTAWPKAVLAPATRCVVHLCGQAHHGVTRPPVTALLLPGPCDASAIARVSSTQQSSCVAPTTPATMAAYSSWASRGLSLWARNLFKSSWSAWSLSCS